MNIGSQLIVNLKINFKMECIYDDVLEKIGAIFYDSHCFLSH